MTKPIFSLAGQHVWVAGHAGMVGGAVVRRLKTESCETITVGRAEVDLLRQDAVERWMKNARPDVIVLAAATVGGILANESRPVDFLYENLMIESNIINAAKVNGVRKLLFLGSSCIYPRLAPQPMPEEALLTGPLEPTNQWYSVAKIAGLMLCQAYRKQFGCDFISAMPTNVYGVGDNFDLASSHVIPALIARAHATKMSGADELVVWGTGAPRREFIDADDLADALVFLLCNYSGDTHINVGTGSDITIRELAETVMTVVGLKARLRFDSSRPDGTPRKLLDIGRLQAMGWRPRTGLQEGLRRAYAYYCEQLA
jgi:GDP-L-fucose synthase